MGVSGDVIFRNCGPRYLCWTHAQRQFVTFRFLLGRLPVTVFKTLNDRLSDTFDKFKESNEPIIYNLISIEKCQAIPKSYVDKLRFQSIA